MAALNIRPDGALDIVSLARSFTASIPASFVRKATECQIHVSGGWSSTSAANLADAFT